MIDTTTLLLFCIASIVLVITPGPNMFYIISRSVGQGRKEGIVSALGVDSGSLVHIGASAIGLSALLVSSALAFTIVKYLGASYLIYLGVNILLERTTATNVETLKYSSLWKIYRQGFITNVLNPKAAIFFLSFFPQFVDVSRGSVIMQILVLGAIFVLIGIAIDLIIASLAGMVGDYLKESIRFWKTQRWFTGSVLIALGVSTALTTSNRSK